MMAHIRAEAERRGDDWLRCLLPDQDTHQLGTHAMRTCRSRPPTFLSPYPPIRRRRPISGNPQLPAAASRRPGQCRAAGRANQAPVDDGANLPATQNNELHSRRCNRPPTGVGSVSDTEDGESACSRAARDPEDIQRTPIRPSIQASIVGQMRRSTMVDRRAGTPRQHSSRGLNGHEHVPHSPFTKLSAVRGEPWQGGGTHGSAGLCSHCRL